MVLLMFSIGVEFSVPDLMRVKWVALIGGPIGILIMLGVAIFSGRFFGWSTTEGFAIGAAIAVASTMVLARLLSDTGRLDSYDWDRDRHYGTTEAGAAVSPSPEDGGRGPACRWHCP